MRAPAITSLAAMVLILVFGVPLRARSLSDSCRPPDPDRSTYWGHIPVLVNISDKPMKILKGAAHDIGEEPIEEVLVEVFELGPDGAPIQHSEDASSRRRIASCITRPNGEFGFNLPPGRYELVCSKPDYNSSSVLFVISPRGKRRQIVVQLNAAD